jgi:hypothetical protein
MRIHEIAAVLGLAASVAVPARLARADETSKTEKAEADVHKQRKELKDKLEQNREELKDKQAEVNKELQDKKADIQKDNDQARKDLNDAVAKLRETRIERRKTERASLKEKYGVELLQRPAVREELRTHAERMARLHQIKRVADDMKNAKKDKIPDRVDKLIERENARHDRAMSALQNAGANAANTGSAELKGTTK